MHLTFICPETKNPFTSEHYSLLADHVITEITGGQRALKGTVTLTSGCPLCGKKHLFAVKEVLCPLSNGEE